MVVMAISVFVVDVVLANNKVCYKDDDAANDEGDKDVYYPLGLSSEMLQGANCP